MKNRLKVVLAERDVKHQDLAQKVGVTRNTVSNLINGNTPRLDLAYQISDALGCSVYDIWPKEEDLGTKKDG